MSLVLVFVNLVKFDNNKRDVGLVHLCRETVLVGCLQKVLCMFFNTSASALVSKSVWMYLCMFVCVCTISEELQEYMESKGAPPPGILTLTTSLSKPFTRLERFPMLLKELDRHMEVSLNLSVFVVFYLTCTDTYQ